MMKYINDQDLGPESASSRYANALVAPASLKTSTDLDVKLWAVPGFGVSLYGRARPPVYTIWQLLKPVPADPSDFIRMNLTSQECDQFVALLRTAVAELDGDRRGFATAAGGVLVKPVGGFYARNTYDGVESWTQIAVWCAVSSGPGVCLRLLSEQGGEVCVLLAKPDCEDFAGLLAEAAHSPDSA